MIRPSFVRGGCVRPGGRTARSLLFGIGVCLLCDWTGSLCACVAVRAINHSVLLGTALRWTWQTLALIVCPTVARLTIAG